MKRLLLLLFMTAALNAAHAQYVDTYFESIRNNTALLTAFFTQMPKGGDLHHHFSGSVFPETYVDAVAANNYYVNIHTLAVADKAGSSSDGWYSYTSLKDSGWWNEYRLKLLQQWSVKDYPVCKPGSDQFFFGTFSQFNIAARASQREGLQEIALRAQQENVSYIETMFSSIPNRMPLPDMDSLNLLLRSRQHGSNSSLDSVLNPLYRYIIAHGAADTAQQFYDQKIKALHNELHPDNDRFTLRYLTFVNRTQVPAEFFKNLVTAFETAAGNNHPLVAGVNIVSPEHDATATGDYELHMQLFRYCHQKYPQVKYSMHAGELTLDQVKPEELTYHITDAVLKAGANRIGHGVDIASEPAAYTVLAYMHRNDIAAEMNLKSNEFILHVSGSAHPLLLYHQFQVPIVISTDDAGILRTTLTEQYVMLTQRYPKLSYKEIKQFVFNSLQYSFIKEPAVKAALLKDLKQRFTRFENLFTQSGIAAPLPQ